jgi:hypothetical protein
MKKQQALAMIFSIFYCLTFAQESETDLQSQQEIVKLNFIVGNWQGSGWMMGRDGQRHNFSQTESIQLKLDSTAILIEGKGMAEGKSIHNAMAIISYNKTDSAYSFHSYLSSGRSGSYNAELKDHKLYWYPGENIRYVIEVNARGQWFEVGEINRGGEWTQFFEMTLDKVKSK